MDPEQIETRLAIAEAAVDLYIRQNGSFTVKEIAHELDMTVADIFNHFPDKRSILRFFYAGLVLRYRLMVDEIEDFDSYMLGEKLSNFAYACFDILAERKPFVDATFTKLIVRSRTKTVYEQEIEALLKEYVENDSLVSPTSAALSGRFFYSFMRRQYLELIRFWLNDQSEDYELTMELTDKLTGFVQEMMYSAVIDKGLDLARFFGSHSGKILGEMPIIKHIRSKIEIR